MDIVSKGYLPGDPRLIDQIVYELKSQGIFDQFRKECIADVDTKPAYQNLRQRVEGSVNNFLMKQKFSGDMNKNQIREQLRKNISESGFLEIGVERIVDQVVNPKINTVFLPKVEDLVYRYLGLERPNRDIKKEVKMEVIDLLPNDLEAVSPESVQDQLMNSECEKKDVEINDNSVNSSIIRTEDESPPFESLEETTKFSLHEENSVDSHLSGIPTSIQNTDAKELNHLDNPVEISQSSKTSFESQFSTETSEDNSKMEICEDANMIEEKNCLGGNKIIECVDDLNLKINTLEADEKKIDDKKGFESRSEDKKTDIKRSSDKHKSRSDRDKKDDKTKKCRSKSESKVREHKDAKPSSKYSSSKDRDKDKKDYRNGKDKDESKFDKVKELDRSKDRSSKVKDKIEKNNTSDKGDSEKDKNKSKSDRDKYRNSGSSSSSKYSKSSSSSSRKDSSSRDKERNEESSSSKNKDSTKDKEVSKNSKDKDKSRSTSSSSKDRKSGDLNYKSSDKYKKSSEKDKSYDKKNSSRKEKKPVDDHYSSKDKRNDRRSTDRDSNDGSGKTSKNSSFADNFNLTVKSTQKESLEVVSGSNGNSTNSDMAEEVITEVHVRTCAEKIAPQLIKCIKPKFASNIQEAMKIMKIRKRLAKLEKRNQLSLSEFQPTITLRENIGEGNLKEVTNAEYTNENRSDKRIKPESPLLKSKELSMESFEALEARLAQEMSNVSSHNMYGEEDDNFECSSLTISPIKKVKNDSGRIPVNNVTIDNRKLVPTEIVVTDNKTENSKEQHSENSILIEGQNKVLKGEMAMETSSSLFECSNVDSEKENKSQSSSNCVFNYDLIQKNGAKTLTVDKNVMPAVRSNLKERENGANSKYVIKYDKSSEITLDVHIEKKGIVSMWEDDNTPCYYFKNCKTLYENNISILNSTIKRLQAAIEKKSLEIHNNIPTFKQGQKRKSDCIDNNNKLIDLNKTRSNVSKYEAKDVAFSDVSHNQAFTLPLSPAESDKSGEHKKDESLTVKPKRSSRATVGRANERYSNEDLYKPRPVFNYTSSRRRGKID